jgi:hypothetical protein
MPKIPDTADGIKVLHTAKRNLEELRRGAGLNLLQIAHLLHPPMCKEAAHSSLQPHCRRHLVGKHLPRQLRRDVHWLLDLLQPLALVLDLLDAGAPIEDPIGEWVLEARPTEKDNGAVVAVYLAALACARARVSVSESSSSMPSPFSPFRLDQPDQRRRTAAM